MKPKPIRLYFRVAMMLFMMMLTTMTAWAGTTIETRTATFYLNGGTSGSTTQQDDWTLVSGGIRLHYNNNATSSNKILLFPDNNQTTLGSSILGCNGFFEFPNLEGTVKSVAFTNFILAYAGTQMYVGLDKSNNSTLLHLAGNATDYDYSGDSEFETHSATFEGSQVVSASNPLKIMFSGTSEAVGYFTFVSGTIVITYDVEVEDTTDPGHTFTFAANANSDAIIATCTEGSGYHTCGLTNRQVTMPLVANNVPFDHYWHSASLDQTDFNSAGITDIGAILSYKDKSTNETLDNPPSAIGNYTVTASVTVTYKETAHPFTLTKDFKIYNGVITCNYPQFSFSPKPAIADNDVTITFTPLAGETVTSLTLTGAMANMSIGNGITDKHDGTYTFTMVSESLTLDATFSAPDASHFEQTDENEYTIKTANGWNWFSYALNSGLVADGFSGKTVKLGTSIESSEMAGTSGHPFKGTFDGQGNTLTFNLQASEGYSAPFHYTDGATISNLHVTGLIEGNDISPLAGLVGKATGNITIENCHVSTEISTTVSISAWHGGIIAFWDDSNVNCTITGCVYDGLIYNPNEANVTSYCFGFIGNSYGSSMDITFTDCLFAPAEYTDGKKALREDYGSYTFVYPKSGLIFHVTNCYYTRNLGRRQGRPATTATTAPANLGAATTDHGIVDGYKNGFLYDGNYYTPKYGDAVVEYRYDDDEERASVTINGTNNQGTGVNVVGVNITEEVGNIKSVTYNRPFNTALAATVILPFSYICDGSEGGKFYSFAGFNGTTPIMEEGNQVTSLTANTPYLFVPTASTMTFPNITNMTNGVTTLQPTTGDYDATAGGWTMKGTYSGKSWTEDATDEYILNDDGELELVTAGTTVKPTGAYLVHGVVFSDLELTLPSCLEIVSVNGQKYSGNGHDFSTDDIVVIREKDFYDATNVAANCTIMDNGDGTYTLVISTHNVVVTADATLALTLANSSDNSEAIEHAALIGEEFSSVTLQGRTLYKDGDWNTLTLPFALSAAEIAASPLAGATIMTLDGTTSNLDGEGLLTLNFETAYDPTIAPSGSIVAGRPYIVKWKPQADLFINSADDWNDFCTRVNNGTESYSGKTVRLTSNISVTKMAGTHSNPFCGTFEGDGYTIEVTLNNNGDTGTSDESYGVAPFRFTSGATIRNLHVGGTITTSTRKYAGGIVGKTVSGTNNIQNCWVSAEIYSTINGDGTHGGFVGKVSGTANITNCLFDGVLTTASGNITNKCGGFVGWRDGTLSISNSMYAPAAIPEGKYTIGTTDTYTFTRNNSSSYNTDNCLYTQALGGAQGTNANAMSNDDKLDKLGSGWKISNGHVVPKMEAVAMPNIVNPVFQNVTVEDPATTEVSFNGGEFVGNFAPLEITDANRNSVVLLAAGNKLGYAKTDRTIANGKALGACRAYFHIPAISGNAQMARRFVMNFGEGDEATGIIEVTANQKSTLASGIYTLDGRKLQGQPTQRGIYIVNGKKIIVK